MRRPRTLTAAAVAVLVLAAAAMPADGRKGPGYRSGKYAGKTAQIDSSSDTAKKKVAIKFKISKGHVAGVNTWTDDTCGHGSHVRVHQDAFDSAKIGPKGRFSIGAGPPGQRAVLKGRVKGSKAHGTLTDSTNDPDTGDHCSASTKWSAKRQKKTLKG